ncbi:hypothetical protein WJX74_010498 [Apatococcus lobatus]|uniref:Protein kinase domain-containing protein n=1 Tax=Apatococcus lobatus TaxID=904363 RepID=A0AAW1QWP6_9CHLO
MQRKGNSLKVADVRRTSNKPAPMAAIYYLMQRGSENPGRLVKLRKTQLIDHASTRQTFVPPPPTFLQSASSWARQQLGWARQQLGRVAVYIASYWAVKRLLQAFRRPRPEACWKQVWSLQELGITDEIGCGRTGRVYAGCIIGQRVAVKVGDYAACKRSLAELRHEVSVYRHLPGEQGVSVPRFVACGHILDSSLYFIATELLGPSLEDAMTLDKDFEPAALHALERVHACGVLHGTRAPPGGKQQEQSSSSDTGLKGFIGRGQCSPWLGCRPAFIYINSSEATSGNPPAAGGSTTSAVSTSNSAGGSSSSSGGWSSSSSSSSSSCLGASSPPPSGRSSCGDVLPEDLPFSCSKQEIDMSTRTMGPGSLCVTTPLLHPAQWQQS